jgi:hypothetical protein
MSHTHDGTYFTQVEEGVFEADAERGVVETGEELDVGGKVVIRVPRQNSDSLVKGIRFIKTPWNTGVVPPTGSYRAKVIHFEVEVEAGADKDGTVPFDPPITLEVPYTSELEGFNLGFFDDKSKIWKTFGKDEIFGHIPQCEIRPDLRIAIVSGIKRWADPHVGWHAV